MHECDAPDISIVMTAYNRAHLLPRALASVYQQTRQDFEVVIVDDGSTDETPQILKTHIDPRIRYIRHDRNQGAVAAYNTGIRAARANLIAFLDSDDTARPHWLERLSDACALDPNVGMVWGWIRLHSANGHGSAIMYRDPFNARPRELLPGMLKWTPGIGTVMVRRQVFDAIGLLDPSVGSLVDVDFAARFAQLGRYTVDIVPEVLMDIYAQPGSLSSHIDERYLEQLKRHVLKHEAALHPYPCVHAYYLYRIARVADALGHADAERYFTDAILLCPANLKYRTYQLAKRWRLLKAWHALSRARTDTRRVLRNLRHPQ